MDIIDVILGKALSSPSQVTNYAALAAKAVTDAQAAVDNISTITEQTATNNQNAEQAVQDANAALATVTEALETISTTGINIPATDSEIDKLAFSLSSSLTNNAICTNLVTTYPSDKVETLSNVVIMYQNEGNNTDGTMTQAAITSYINSVKQQLQTQINNMSGAGGGGSTNLGIENAGNIVIIGADGNIISGSAAENQVISALIQAGLYTINGAVGVEFDYSNQIYARTQEAGTYTSSSDYDKYSMYGGRMRCNVADDGTITAWYGDPTYTEDGSNGQVMVYQPKFYYQRVPVIMDNGHMGKIIRKESLILTDQPLAGFKLHPLFINEQNEEVDYALLPAYDGSIYDTSISTYFNNDRSGVTFSEDKLSSIAGVKPASGKYNMLTISNAELLAKNRGPGWHTMNMRAESANQMLFMTEYASPNGQITLELGLCKLPNNINYNCSAITGSTASLGNTTGYAESTIAEINGNFNTYTTVGKRAVSYRGMENPWGNIWHYVGDIIINGNGNTRGGIPYICTDYNYTPTVLGSNYESIGFDLPNAESFISAFGYGNSKYDWIYLPAECASNANNLFPIGDCSWTTSNLNGTNVLIAGGAWHFEENDGLFCTGGDYSATTYARSYGAKLIHVPIKNGIHNANIASWTAKMGG